MEREKRETEEQAPSSGNGEPVVKTQVGLTDSVLGPE